MTGFKPLALTAVALLTVAAPAQAGKSDAASEVALHIEAEAAIPPDRAAITITLNGSGSSDAEALADLKRKQAKVVGALVETGLPAGAIKNGDPVKATTPAILITEDVADEADAAAAAAAASEAACDAAAPAPSRRSKARAVATDCPAPEAKFHYTASSVVTVDNLTMLPKIRAKQTELGLPIYNYFTNTRFYASDPTAQAKLGREQAVAKARKDADDYAATLGYHVIRMTRVSNGSPPFGMRDLHTLVNYADYAMDQTVTPSFYGAATYATVSIDFVIAPN